MLTGNGDTSKLGEEEQHVLAALRRMVETGHLVSLNQGQTTLVLEMIDWFSQWKSVLRLLHSIRNVTVLLGGLLVAWWAGQEAIVAWIRSLVAP